MARTRTKVSDKILFTWCMLGGIILLFSPSDFTNKFQFAFARVFRTPLGVGRSITLSARTTQPLKEVVSKKEYNKVLNELANVTQERDQALQKVESLSGFQRKYAIQNAKFILAEIIKCSSTDIIINCGQDYNLSKGQFVLAENSIIDSICDVWDKTAQVRLITNLKSKTAVKIGQLNFDAVMKGSGNGSAKIRLVPKKYKVHVGDDVFALKVSGFLTTPMIVGKVSACRTDSSNPLLWDITVKPVCDFERLTEIAVISSSRQK